VVGMGNVEDPESVNFGMERCIVIMLDCWPRLVIC